MTDVSSDKLKRHPDYEPKIDGVHPIHGEMLRPHKMQIYTFDKSNLAGGGRITAIRTTYTQGLPHKEEITHVKVRGTRKNIYDTASEYSRNDEHINLSIGEETAQLSPDAVRSLIKMLEGNL